MAAEPSISPSSRRLGEYLGCSNQAIQAALSRQGGTQDDIAGKRLGELLLEEEAISLDALLAGIQAQRVDRLRACPLFTSLSNDDLAELSTVFQEVSVPTDKSLIEQDDRRPAVVLARERCGRAGAAVPPVSDNLEDAVTVSVGHQQRDA